MENAVAPYNENLPAVRQPSIFESPERFALAEKIGGYLAKSKDMIPINFQGSPENCVIALNLADRMGVDVMALMQSMHVIHGKPGLDGKFIIALINQSGQFKEPLDFIFEGSGNDARCTCRAERINGKVCEATVTWQMVVQEGWLSKSGSKWKTMPDQMFTYRSASFFSRRHCPGLLLGMRSADEWEDIGPTKVTGHAIDTPIPETAPEGKPPAPVYQMKKAPKTNEPDPESEKKEPVSVMPNNAKTARGTGWDKDPAHGPMVDLSAPDPEPNTDTPAEAETPENGATGSCQVAHGFAVGSEYSYYSAKLKKTITVKITDIDAKDPNAPIFRVERTVDGKGQGEFVNIPLESLMSKPPLDENGMSTDPAVEAQRQAAEKKLAEKNNAEPLTVEDMNRLGETGMKKLIEDAQRMAVTPEDVKVKFWEKIKKFGYKKIDHPEYLAWLNQETEGNETTPAFTGQPTDLIGNDPEHKALKKIHAWIKDSGFDDAGVKLAMRLFKVGDFKPFDLASRNEIQLQHVRHFEALLEDIAPAHALREVIMETEKIARMPVGSLMGKALSFVQSFSPAIAGNMTHIYETLYQEPLRDKIMDSLDEWCKPEAPPKPEQQTLGDLPVLSKFGDAVNYAAKLVNVEMSDELAGIVRDFFKEVFDAGPVQIANALPSGAAEKIADDFAGFYAAKIG